MIIDRRIETNLKNCPETDLLRLEHLLNDCIIIKERTKNYKIDNGDRRIISFDYLLIIINCLSESDVAI